MLTMLLLQVLLWQQPLQLLPQPQPWWHQPLLWLLPLPPSTTTTSTWAPHMPRSTQPLPSSNKPLLLWRATLQFTLTLPATAMSTLVEELKQLLLPPPLLPHQLQLPLPPLLWLPLLWLPLYQLESMLTPLV